MDLPRVILDETQLRRITGYLTETIPFDEIKSIKAKYNNDKVTAIRIVTAKQQFIFAHLEQMEVFLNTLSKLVSVKIVKKKVWAAEVIITFIIGAILIGFLLLEPRQSFSTFLQIAITVVFSIYLFKERPISAMFDNPSEFHSSIVGIVIWVVFLITTWVFL